MAITHKQLEQALQETRTGPHYCAKCVQTRDRRQVRVLAIDDERSLPVIIQVRHKNNWVCTFMSLDGIYFEGVENPCDLVPTPRTYTGEGE